MSHSRLPERASYAWRSLFLKKGLHSPSWPGPSLGICSAGGLTISFTANTTLPCELKLPINGLAQRKWTCLSFSNRLAIFSSVPCFRLCDVRNERDLSKFKLF